MQEAIEGYLGTPYQWGGSSPAGIDCSGLVMRVYQRVGIDLPRNTNGQRRWGRSVGFQDLQFGDVLFFRGQAGGEGGKSLHAGIFLGGGRFVHASKSRGVIVDDLDEGYWLGLFLEGRRFLE
jgi:cell wall-associated NlpC family hydrolase